MFPADPADDPWHGLLLARARDRDAWLVEVDAFEGGGEAVGIALAPDLAVGDDVDAGRLLRADREQSRIVLCFFQKGFFNPPKLACAHARWDLFGQPLAVDEPVGLWVAPH